MQTSEKGVYEMFVGLWSICDGDNVLYSRQSSTVICVALFKLHL